MRGGTGRATFYDRDGNPVLTKLQKSMPTAIDRFIGRRPLSTFGNSDGDVPMLRRTMAEFGARFAGIIHDTDAEREWTYDAPHIGTLDKGLEEEPEAHLRVSVGHRMRREEDNHE
jgi:hypothetical protein